MGKEDDVMSHEKKEEVWDLILDYALQSYIITKGDQLSRNTIYARIGRVANIGFVRLAEDYMEKVCQYELLRNIENSLLPEDSGFIEAVRKARDLGFSAVGIKYMGLMLDEVMVRLKASPEEKNKKMLDTLISEAERMGFSGIAAKFRPE